MKVRQYSFQHHIAQGQDYFSFLHGWKILVLKMKMEHIFALYNLN